MNAELYAVMGMSPYRNAVDQAHAYVTRGSKPISEETMRWVFSTLIVLTPADLDILYAWLKGNEKRIADGDDGMGMLRTVFLAIVGAEPT